MIYKGCEVSELLTKIHQEDVLVFPTDTVYGIGASIHSPKALDRIFEIKNRPTEKSLIILYRNQNKLKNGKIDCEMG